MLMASHPTVKAADLQRIGISKPYAHQLASGRGTPSLKKAVEIEEKLGIPVSAWPMPRKPGANTTPADRAA